MRIIGGSAGGMRLLTPKGLETRPTPDMVREALFNIIADEIPGARVLDAFAGSGAVGLEALSRGAGFCCFSDIRPECAAIIKRNAEATGFTEKTDIRCSAADKSLRYYKQCCIIFQIVYLDPPYGKNLETPVIEIIRDGGVLAEGGLIILESGTGPSPGLDLGPGLRLYRSKRYGGTNLSFIRKV
jgi:16S rRNA (guanine(966)-N(2))-methyltransferase RsmD